MNKFRGESALRLRQILHPTGPIPVSASSWWAGVKKGIYPQPIKLGPRITAWKKSDIDALLQRGLTGPTEAVKELPAIVEGEVAKRPDYLASLPSLPSKREPS